MSLRQSLLNIATRLDVIRKEIINAIGTKGVITPIDTKYNRLAYYINQIYQERFRFDFSFKVLDQFGTPHIVNSGHEWYGMPSDCNLSISFNLPKFVWIVELTYANPNGYGVPSKNSNISSSNDAVLNSDKLIFSNFKQINTITEDLHYNENALV